MCAHGNRRKKVDVPGLIPRKSDVGTVAKFRLRIQLFKGRKSIDLGRLGQVPEELNKFLKALGDDLRLSPEENHWQASRFADGSLALSVGLPNEVTDDVAERGTAIVQQIADVSVRPAVLIATNLLSTNEVVLSQPDRLPDEGPAPSDATLLRFANFARSLREGETCRIGVYKTARARAPTKWYPITLESADRLSLLVQPLIEYEGTVFGVVHAVYKEGSNPHFDLRDLSRGSLVKCYFNDSLWPHIVKALAIRDNRVHVSGRVRANRIDRVIESVVVGRIEPTERLSDLEFEQFIGCAPEITGALTTAQFIDTIRGDGD